MAETSKMKGVKSPEEIEEEIKSTPTVNWDPFTVLPKEIYLMMFDMLEKAEDKQNFMNAHLKFYELFKSERVLFLFQQVFNEVIRNAEYEDLFLDRDTFKDYNQIFKPYQNCRLVCHDWDVGFQNYFQWHESFFAFDHYDDIWSPKYNLTTCMPGFVWEPCNSLDLYLRADDELEKFSVTHPPSKNPFFSRSITLLPFCYEPEEAMPEEVEIFRTSVDKLLEKYGQHIWHCKIEIEEKLNPEACICIGKWISLMPELKTLQLKYEEEEEVEPLSMVDLQEIEDAQLIRSEMKNLIFLRSAYIPAILFNKLVGNLPQLQKIQIKIFKGKESFLRDFELMIEKEKLEEAFLTLKGYEDFEYLQGSQPFPNLRKLAITLEFETDEERNNKAYSKWPEWRMIFEILEGKFPALEELSLRLPKVVSTQDKLAAIDPSLGCQLNLQKLKKLWVVLPNLCSLDFLHPCKALKELQVVLEHSEWDLKASRKVERRRQGRPKINVNMWASNIWEVFPKLYKLKIWAWCETRSGFNQYNYEKNNGEKRESVDFSSRVANAFINKAFPHCSLQR